MPSNIKTSRGNSDYGTLSDVSAQPKSASQKTKDSSAGCDDDTRYVVVHASGARSLCIRKALSSRQGKLELEKIDQAIRKGLVVSSELKESVV